MFVKNMGKYLKMVAWGSPKDTKIYVFKPWIQ